MRKALSFLTPIGGATMPGPSSLVAFPLVGAGIGAVLALAFFATGHSLLAAGIVVVGDLVLTGMLHFDGLVDAADGLLSHMNTERRLLVMAEPGVGAFGLGAGVAVLLLRFAALGTLQHHKAIFLLVGIWSLSRGAMAFFLSSVTYVGGGLGAVFLGSRHGIAGGVLGLGIGFVGAFLWNPICGPIALAGGILGSLAVVLVAKKKLGGITGDVLGASGVILETVALVIAAAIR